MMRTWIPIVLAAVISAAHPALAGGGESWNDPKLYNLKLHNAYMKKVEDALGVFHDIKVWDRASDTEEWKLLAGTYIPVTVDGHAPETFFKDMRSDRPMMLPTRVEGFTGGDGQSNPYTVVGRMPGSNPEVQWVFLVRKYYLKKPTDENFIDAGDVAIIGHHPRTGASTYFQFYDPGNPKSAQVVVSPFSGEKGMRFWSPLVTNAKVFQCQRCHNADPFIHTPWIDQVRVSEPKDGEPFPEPMLPSNPLGPFFSIDSEEGGLFAFWEDWLRHLDAPKNACTQCHRVTPFDLSGLYQNSTQYAGVTRPKYNQFAVESHSYQTDKFTDLPWMPPVNPGDFYAGQSLVGAIWREEYMASAAEVNQLTAEDSQKLRRVPQPPREFRKIMVDRPHQDEVAPKHSVWIVDTRMRANTDGRLAEWRFFSKEAAAPGLLAAPVVFRGVPGDGSSTQFKVAFIGQPQGYQSARSWTSVMNGETYDLKQGDYLGLVLINEGDQAGPGLVPYTVDDWAKLKWADGTPRYPDGVVSYLATTQDHVEVGATLTFGKADYRTYSFEMRNRL